ncbi:MAG: 3'-5' exonuclease [Caldilineaceae bacterium]|nr:3'-5' exonuclease [Caldilineaceae bacterium]
MLEEVTTPRQHACVLARQRLQTQPLFLDTETTGVRSTAEIIEICLIDHNGDVLLNSLVRPRLTIPAESTKVHGITTAMVAHAPTWPELWPQIQAILANRPLGIYNADFDLRLLKQTHQQSGLLWPAFPFEPFCIMQLYAQFYGEWDIHRNAYRWQSLEKAGRHFSIALPNSHRAKDDALLARAVLHQIAAVGQ